MVNCAEVIGHCIEMALLPEGVVELESAADLVCFFRGAQCFSGDFEDSRISGGFRGLFGLG
jgi:hypothetical protein